MQAQAETKCLCLGYFPLAACAWFNIKLVVKGRVGEVQPGVYLESFRETVFPLYLPFIHIGIAHIINQGLHVVILIIIGVVKQGILGIGKNSSGAQLVFTVQLFI